MSVSVAVCRRHASAVLAALSEHTAHTWTLDMIKVALLPTFKDLHTIYQFDLAVLSTVAGVSFDTIGLMLNDEPVKEEEARLVLRAASKQSGQTYTVNNVDVNLVKETVGTAMFLPFRAEKERSLIFTIFDIGLICSMYETYWSRQSLTLNKQNTGNFQPISNVIVDENLKNFSWRKAMMRKKFLIVPILALVLLLFQTKSVFACGGLVAPDGDVRLQRASTLIAWHDGVEHYLTSFAYQGTEANVGWIVPLPAVPEKIEAGGAWTFQRLSIESHPRRLDVLAQVAASAQVLQQVQVEALNVTVVKGSGQEILNWASQNGFFIDGDTKAHLLVYAQGSPIFMAAKYDTQAAQARHQLEGDGVPLLITMKTPHPWVPLEVLALDGQQVQADLYFLTDMPLNISDVNAKIGQSAVGSTIPGATGFTVAHQEKMTDQLYKDLSSDRNMSWVRQDSWFTYLSLNTPSEKVTYDLGVSNDGVISLALFGTPPVAVVNGADFLPKWLPTLPLHTPEWVVSFLLIGLVVFSVVFLSRRARRKRDRYTVVKR